LIALLALDVAARHREARMDDRTHDRTAPGTGLTQSLAARAQAVRHELLSSEARQLVRQCLLDYVAVTLAGAAEPLTAMVLAEMAEQGGAPNATVFLHGGRLPVLSAALVNGTASHALDYDDVNLAMPGHPTVAIMPALLALAEETHASGSDLIAAFVAGYAPIPAYRRATSTTRDAGWRKHSPALVAPLLGGKRADALRETILRIDEIQDIGDLTRQCVH
jgi:hypothetical protein